MPTLSIVGQGPAATKTSQSTPLTLGSTTCGTGKVATGLDGKTGTDVDQIGLYCETMVRNP